MMNKETFKVLLKAVITVAVVAALSYVSVMIWGGKSEKLPEDREYVLSGEMTVGQFGQVNDLPNPVLKELFGLQSREDLGRTLNSFGVSLDQIVRRAEGAAALAAEHESKDWSKIVIKFTLWTLFLAVVFIVMRRGMIKPKLRRILYMAGILLFGIVLGSDPSAMGTVKDAIVLFTSKGVIFPPRIMALTIFLLMVLLFNKSICSWGCQAGVLQDLLFRLNRNAKDTRGIVRQYKIPFSVTNTIRTLFLVLFTFAAILWGTDIIEPVDPFKIYKPAALAGAGIVFVGFLFLASVFVYRPWCHLLCPFGLVGWFVEKMSVFRIKVNYETCIACEACAKACPSSVMGAILKQDRTIPDCFSCANCIDVCPTNSVSLAAGKREAVPEGKFEK
jgi:Pyruvate/2-oxoacid:ferredoxin oxidoreductase delta subunit